jgi:hypothetical protein
MNRSLAIILSLLGIIFLVFPLTSDSFSHYTQDKTYRATQENILSCRSELALKVFSNPRNQLVGPKLEKNLDVSCGTLPRYDDFAYDQNSIISLYNWIGQKITFIPL